MSLLEILITIFVIFAAGGVFLQLRLGRISIRQFIFWEIIWAILLVFGLFPDLFSFLEVLGVGRIVDAVVYICIGILFYMIYRIIVQLELLRRELTTLTRHLSYTRAQERKKRK